MKHAMTLAVGGVAIVALSLTGCSKNNDKESTETTGTSISIVKPPPSTTNSGVTAVSTTPRSQPAVSPRVPGNSARTTKTGPTASSTAGCGTA